jgi:hypothetical protein
VLRLCLCLLLCLLLCLCLLCCPSHPPPLRRANVRVDNKQFLSAISDYDESLRLMAPDGEIEDSQGGSTGRARYPEYPDTFVGERGKWEPGNYLRGTWDWVLGYYNMY